MNSLVLLPLVISAVVAAPGNILGDAVTYTSSQIPDSAIPTVPFTKAIHYQNIPVGTEGYRRTIFKPILSDVFAAPTLASAPIVIPALPIAPPPLSNSTRDETETKSDETDAFAVEAEESPPSLQMSPDAISDNIINSFTTLHPIPAFSLPLVGNLSQKEVVLATGGLLITHIEPRLRFGYSLAIPQVKTGGISSVSEVNVKTIEIGNFHVKKKTLETPSVVGYYYPDPAIAIVKTHVSPTGFSYKTIA